MRIFVDSTLARKLGSLQRAGITAIRHAVQRLPSDERGVSAIEYCVLMAFLALAINLTMASLGIGIDQGLQHISNALADGSSPPQPTTSQSASQGQ